MPNIIVDTFFLFGDEEKKIKTFTNLAGSISIDMWKNICMIFSIGQRGYFWQSSSEDASVTENVTQGNAIRNISWCQIWEYRVESCQQGNAIVMVGGIMDAGHMPALPCPPCQIQRTTTKTIYIYDQGCINKLWPLSHTSDNYEPTSLSDPTHCNEPQQHVSTIHNISNLQHQGKQNTNDKPILNQYASVYLPPSLSTLCWSCTRRKASTPRLRLGVLAFLLVQLQLKYASSKFKYTSATPRCTWTWTQRTWEESVVGTSCNFSSSTPRPSPSPTRLRLVGLGLGLGVLERSRPSTPPPAVVLIPKY